MELKKEIKRYLIKSLVLAACFYFTTAFIPKTGGKTIAEVTVNIVQENDGFIVSVKTTKIINVHFYLFTVDGRLVKELNISGSKRISINQLEKGIYIYDFFSSDERLKNGKIELRY